MLFASNSIRETILSADNVVRGQRCLVPDPQTGSRQCCADNLYMHNPVSEDYTDRSYVRDGTRTNWTYGSNIDTKYESRTDQYLHRQQIFVASRIYLPRCYVVRGQDCFAGNVCPYIIYMKINNLFSTCELYEHVRYLVQSDNAPFRVIVSCFLEKSPHCWNYFPSCS